jgi:hypothetical protein
MTTDRATIAALRLALQQAAMRVDMLHAVAAHFREPIAESRRADLARWRAMAEPTWEAPAPDDSAPRSPRSPRSTSL